MNDRKLKQEWIELYDNFTHGTTSRRVFMELLAPLKRQWLAIAAIVVLFGGLGSADSAHWYQVPFFMVWVAVMLLTLVRLGLVAAVVLGAVGRTFYTQPMTADLGAWWAGGTIGTLVVVAAIAGYGFVTSLGGRSPFGEGILGDNG